MRKRRILLVDDDGDIRSMVRKLLEVIAGGATIVVECSTLIEALNALAESVTSGNRFDLVITDFQIPAGKEGGDIARAVKELSPSVPVIIMSGNMEGVLKSEAPADFILSKPFEFRAFANTVTKGFEIAQVSSS